MEDVWECGLELEKPIIDIEGNSFYSLKEAGEYLNISAERVRQKLNDLKF